MQEVLFMNNSEYESEYKKYRNKAEEYINDREKTRNLLEQATKKAKKTRAFRQNMG